MPIIERGYTCSFPVVVYCVSGWRWTWKFEEKCQSLEIKLSIVSEEAFCTQTVLSQAEQQIMIFLIDKPLPRFSSPWAATVRGLCLRLLLTHRASKPPWIPCCQGNADVRRRGYSWQKYVLLHKIGVAQENHPDTIRTCWESFSVIPYTSAPDFELFLPRKQELLLFSPFSHMWDAMVGDAHLPSSPPRLKDSLGCLDRVHSSLKADRCKRGQTASGESLPSLIGADWWLHLNSQQYTDKLSLLRLKS